MDRAHPTSEQRGLKRAAGVLVLAAFALAACDRVPGPRLAGADSGPRALPSRAATETAAAPPAPAPVAPQAPAELLSDGVLAARIKAGLLTDPAMAGSDVSVNIDHGIVHLTGNVASREQAAIASAHAQREDGVMRIDNDLAVAAQ
jgi:hypothetical protein